VFQCQQGPELPNYFFENNHWYFIEILAGTLLLKTKTESVYTESRNVPRKLIFYTFLNYSAATYTLRYHFYRAAICRAVLAMRTMSARPSVCQTREL